MTRSDRDFIAAREPHVPATEALWSPETGWIDADAYVRTLTRELGRHRTSRSSSGHAGHRDRAARRRWTRRRHAPANASTPRPSSMRPVSTLTRFHGWPAARRSSIFPCRGEYAELAPRARHLVRGLVYPVPHASGHGLGVHLTRTLGGAVWVGPTIRYQEGKADYENGSSPARGVSRADARATAVGDARRPAAGGQRHPPEAASADRTVRRFPDSPGSTESRSRSRIWH